jgi:outer membrane autotransporter protein
LTAKLVDVEAYPAAKNLSEGFLAGLALLTGGADLAAGPGLAGALAAAQGAGGALAGFGVVSGSSLRHRTGSHVDVDGFSLLAGLARGFETGPGRLTLGGFLEYGAGGYDAYNSFSGLSVRGQGDVRNIGLGLLGRLEIAGPASGRPYAEASLRAGQAYNDYHSDDLRDLEGRRAEYSSTSAYFGAHFGGGYILNLTEALALDLYGKYLWTRLGGDSLTLSTNDPVSFEAVNSRRLRGGARLTWALNENVSPYAGAAYEYEFDGRALASSYGYALGAPSLKGGTGLAELGLNIKPDPASPFSLDFALQGHTGQREGLGGSLRLKFEF